MKTLRILWITHDLFECIYPYVKGKPTKGGSWIAPLFYSLHGEEHMKLGAITPVVDGQEQKQIIDKVSYYTVPIRKNGNLKAMRMEQVDCYLRAIADFKPDLIHVHGTEKNFGLLRKHIDAKIPVVCSIQGIIHPYYDSLKFSIATIHIEKYRSLKNRLGRGGIKSTLRKWKKYLPLEMDIYQQNQYFIGRTFWDKAQLLGLNSQANYFHGEELLRSPFYSTLWNIDHCERHRIFISSAAYPIKGFHVLLHALVLLKERYPAVMVVAPLSMIDFHSSGIRDFLTAEDYHNYIKYEIKRLQLEDHIIFLKKLSAEEMAEQYRKSHVFVLPSFVENSPNALGESMLVGTPSIVSPVGGVTSIIKDEESALLFPTGDHRAMAYQIDRLFSDDALAVGISTKAREIALKRHDVKQVTEQYNTIYSKIIKHHNESIAYSPRA